ncbi:hypothetical protein MGH68_14890 [Erysipelothrix sp. D19-032]
MKLAILKLIQYSNGKMKVRSNNINQCSMFNNELVDKGRVSMDYYTPSLVRMSTEEENSDEIYNR